MALHGKLPIRAPNRAFVGARVDIQHLVVVRRATHSGRRHALLTGVSRMSQPGPARFDNRIQKVLEAKRPLGIGAFQRPFSNF